MATGHRILYFGIEYYTFRINLMIALDIANTIKRTGEWRHRLVALYLIEPKPSANDLLDMKMKQVGKKEVEVNLQIARGHHLISEFFQRHEAPKAERDDHYVYLSCSCHEAVKRLEVRSLPNKDWLWEDFLTAGETKTLDSPVQNG
jgi:hypothetical protein